MTEEIWRDVLGYVGAYQVSSLGRVRSVDRHVLASNGSRMFFRGRVLQTWQNKRGYVICDLARAGARRRPAVHRLVAAAFNGPRPDGLETRHLNGVAWDNRAENLQYGTSSQNELDKVLHGTHNHAKQTHCKRNHPLIPVNLIPSQLPLKRSCLACSLALGYRRRHPETDIQTMSDWYYQRITTVPRMEVDPDLCRAQQHSRDNSHGKRDRYGFWVCQACRNERRKELKREKRAALEAGAGQAGADDAV